MDETPQLHSRRYVVYDSKTGAVVTAYQVVAPASEALPSLDEVREQLRGLLDDDVLERAEVLEYEDESPHIRHFVDPKRRELRAHRRIEVSVEKTELEGDGEDSTELEIAVIDPDSGDVDESFSGALVVSTTRGRLSNRGGRVEAQEGRASIRLVSAPETVRAVQVVVEDPEGRAEPATATIEFV